MVTTLKTSSYPIENVPFPTVTICASGLNMDNVEKAIGNKFATWRKENGRNGRSEERISEDMADYMSEAFQINNTESGDAANILDILNTMVASDVESSVGLNGVRDNILSCAAEDELEQEEDSTNGSRRKREIELNLNDSFCCEKMLLTLDTEALGVPSNLNIEHEKWNGFYTLFHPDDQLVFKNTFFRWIKVSKDGSWLKFESWCKEKAILGSGCTDDGTSATSRTVSPGTSQNLFTAKIEQSKVKEEDFCRGRVFPWFRYNKNWGGDSPEDLEKGNTLVRLSCQQNNLVATTTTTTTTTTITTTTVTTTTTTMTPDQKVKAAEAVAVSKAVVKKKCLEPPKKTESTTIQPTQSSSLPKIDIFLNPNRMEEVAAISGRKQTIAKTYFANSDIKKLYPQLFQILWESTLPCFPGDLIIGRIFLQNSEGLKKSNFQGRI